MNFQSELDPGITALALQAWFFVKLCHRTGEMMLAEHKTRSRHTEPVRS
jgi:hypothetical protein